MKKRIFSLFIALSMMLCLVPVTAFAVQDSTVKSAKTNFGLTNEKVNYVYLNTQGAYKSVFKSDYPHFIDSSSGTYHIHGKLEFDKIPDFSLQRPNNIEIKAGGRVSLLFDGTLDGDEGLVWDYSLISYDNISAFSNEYSMIKIKNGSENKVTYADIHFAGKCKIAAPVFNSVINSYGKNCDVTIYLHDDCDVTLIGGDFGAAIGGGDEEDGRNITIKTDGKYDENGRRVSYKGNGKITCKAGTQAAAIGSGNLGDADNIVIESGTVYAYGGYGSAGIGAGQSSFDNEGNVTHASSNIKIKGGEVHAYGGSFGAGIGGGDETVTKNITIEGGKVYANGGTYGAGIGSGENGDVENIYIGGGTIEAVGGKHGAGIGSGAKGNVNRITVSGGKITAKLSDNTNGYPIGRGGTVDGTTKKSENVKIEMPDNRTATYCFKLKKGDEFSRKIFSCDSYSLTEDYVKIVDELNYSIERAEINFEKCDNHSLNWHPTLHYQYCSNCQSVKAYDDNLPTISGVDDTVLRGSWVNFKSKDLSNESKKTIIHNYLVGEDARSVKFENVPETASGIKNVTVSTYTYDLDSKSYNILSNTQTLAETEDNNGTKSYQFKGANTQKEALDYKNATTEDEKSAALKLQQISIVDNAGNVTKKNVIAFLTHRIECYVDGQKQIIDKDNGKDYLDVTDGSYLKLTFLKDSYAKLDYQYYYFVTVNGNRIPTTEDNIYEFNNIQEDIEVQINTKFDETAPQLKIKINDDEYSSNDNNNDLSDCKMISTCATVTLSAEDIAEKEHPASGISDSSFEYLISNKPLSENELKNSDGWTKYTGPFNLPDSKTSIIYARVKDIAGNTVYAASAPYLPDETAPTISGLENNKIYCGEVRFSATDENGIEKVTVGDNVISPDSDGKYTLAAGIGKVTVSVYDKAGFSTTVSVTVNSGHTAGDDDGDCSTPIYCTYHPDVIVVPAKSHDFSGEWQKSAVAHWHICQNEGCSVCEKSEPHSGVDDGDCTTAVICVCGQEITPAKSEHTFGEWSANIDNTHTRRCIADGCSAGIETEACTDSDNDHKCDTCGKVISECTDTDNDHKCDICGKVLSECVDTDNDHKCDICGKVVSECTDTDNDHKCDICGKVVSECADSDNDHKCDICGKVISECVDTDNDHKCDICGKEISECVDTDNDHKCDICGKEISECTDTDNDHKCDICGKVVSECTDSDNDHKCDTCGKVLSECADTDNDHKCDICGKVLSECTDTDNDHKCDICGKVVSECTDTDNDHKCDICGKVISECTDTDNDHKCDICGKVVSECTDTDNDHKCDICGKVISECTDTDNDHKCDICGKVLREITETESTTDGQYENDSPNTGNDCNSDLWIFMLLISAGICSAAEFIRRKNASVK